MSIDDSQTTPDGLSGQDSNLPVEEKDETPVLTPVMTKFILHWGEMGARWGTNRTVAQIHALLYIWPKPLNAEQITKTLGVARSNVSTSLRELQGWGIVKVVHVMGDRRDHFETIKDVWDVFQTVLSERKKREIDPTTDMIRECLDESQKNPEAANDYTEERLKDMLELVETMSDWYDQMKKIDSDTLIKMLKLGQKLKNFLP